MELLKNPWPWYVAGPLIGLIVPLLLILGNKSFGISATLRHICAACIPGKLSFFNYDWRKESWNLLFVCGVLIGGFLAAFFMSNGNTIKVDPELVRELKNYNISVSDSLIPTDLFNWENLLTLKGFIMMVVGGFLVGFGTRYAGGCTSGHAISGISNLQWTSVVATICFMAGGFIASNLLLPYILSL